MKNSELVKKAVWSIADLAADGGLLDPQQSDQFINYILDAPTMLPRVRNVRMTAPITRVNRINFGQRLLQVAEEGVCPDSSSPQTSRAMELVAREYIARIDLPYTVIEDNIMGGNIGQRRNGGGDSNGGIVDLIMQMLAQQVALDIEELALLGDTADPDPYLASQDGWLKLAQGQHVVDAGGAPLSGAILAQGLAELPPVFQRNVANLRHFTSTNQRLNYVQELGQRQTPLGDAQFQGTAPVLSLGSPVEGVSMLPQDRGLFTMWNNLVLGFWRQVHIETDKVICDRTHRIVVTTRFAVSIEDTDAAVSYINLG